LWFVDCCLLFGVACCLLLVAGCLLFVVCCLLAVGCCSLFGVSSTTETGPTSREEIYRWERAECWVIWKSC